VFPLFFLARLPASPANARDAIYREKPVFNI
jgi:hypothetical protein